MSIVVIVAQPPDGVKVYVVVPTVDVLIVDGFQIPLMLFCDKVDNAGAVLFWHNGPIGANTGATCATI